MQLVHKKRLMALHDPCDGDGYIGGGGGGRGSGGYVSGEIFRASPFSLHTHSPEIFLLFPHFALYHSLILGL